MKQSEMALLAEYPQPLIIANSVVQLCETYREAVRMSWALRRVRYDTYASFAAKHGFLHQHLSDYCNPDDAPGRKDLPAKLIPRWNCAVGNALVTQWLTAANSLTLLEEIQATRRAA